MSQAFKLSNDQIFVILEAPGGLYNPEQLKLIAEVCDAESIIVKVTEDQRLGVMITEEQFEEVKTKLQPSGLGMRHYRSALHQAVSCLGAHCPFAEQDALASAIAITEKTRTMTSANAIRIGVNGCARACVPSQTLDISLTGDQSGFRVHLGGKNREIPELASFFAEGVPPDQLVEMIAKAIDLYNQNAQPDESLQDVMQRMGTQPFAKIFAPFSQDAAGDADPFAEIPEGSVEEPATEVSEEVEALNEEPKLDAEEQTQSAPVSDSSEDLDSILDDAISPTETAGSADLEEEMEVDVAPKDEVLAQSNGTQDDSHLGEVSVGMENHDDTLVDEIAPAGQGSGDDAAKMADDVLINQTREAPELETKGAIDLDDTLADVLDSEPVDLLGDEEPSTVMQEDADLLDSTLDEIVPVSANTETPLDTEEVEQEDFEAKLNDSIEEQKFIESIAQDENSAERNQVLDFAESAQAQDGSAPDLEFEEPEENTVQDNEVREESETYVSSDRENAAPANTLPVGGSDHIEGVSICNGVAKLSFGSGAAVTISVAKLRDQGGQRRLTINGQTVEVRMHSDHLNVEMDGIELSVPNSNDKKAA